MSGPRRRPGPSQSNRRGSSASGPSGGGRRGGPAKASPGRRAPERSPSPARGSRRGRDPEGAGLGGTQVEGRQAVRELLLAGRRRVTEVLIAAERDSAEVLDDIRGLARDHRAVVKEVSRRTLDDLSGTEASQGVVAFAAELRPVELESLCPPELKNPFLVALDGVTDPRNLGAIMRTAECAGVDGVIIPRHRAAHFSPTATKTAAGAIEYVPTALVGGLPAAIERLKSQGVWVVGLDEAGDTSVFDLTVASGPVCLVLGSEGRGLSRLTRTRCDALVRIPLAGNVDSLNVGAAAAVAVFEVARRRATA